LAAAKPKRQLDALQHFGASDEILALEAARGFGNRRNWRCPFELFKVLKERNETRFGVTYRRAFPEPPPGLEQYEENNGQKWSDIAYENNVSEYRKEIRDAQMPCLLVLIQPRQDPRRSGNVVSNTATTGMLIPPQSKAASGRFGQSGEHSPTFISRIYFLCRSIHRSALCLCSR